ncbi:MAG TPA: hypothetical protein VFT57_18920 [Gemmatimonadaceae bacterium]|nr:hypothetical protein [Gemmatimonadaceae bacterium]
MHGILRRFRRPRSRVLVLAACLALAAQSVASLLAPAAEARASRSAPAHVESGGTHQHHSHNPADCAACIALQLTGIPQRPPADEAIVVEKRPINPPPALHLASASRRDDRHSRAPPTPSIPLR